jgi:very-short-patch-repair endonuclease
MGKQELIKYLVRIENIFKYSIKGGTSMFNKEHPKILDEINKYTKEMQIYSKNKILVAKLLFLTKYHGNIKNIIDDKNVMMIYDNKLCDFKTAKTNAAQKQWNSCKSELSNIKNYYSKEETIQKLKNIYKKYLGKSGNRKLIKDDKKLYLSVFKHTNELDSLNKNLNKFSMRLHILIHNHEIMCPIHNKLKHWKFINGQFKITCKECKPKYPSKDWFLKTYGNEWEKYYVDRKLKLKKIKTNSLSWYIKKYGEKLGGEKYVKSVELKLNRLTELKANRYSQISQELFWEIYNQLNDISNVYFHELNKEFVIKIPEKYNYNKTVMIVDFIQNNNIIEYNGEYWHNKKNDVLRSRILRDIGYNVLFVSSNEYNRNKKNQTIIKNCINFLEC